MTVALDLVVHEERFLIKWLRLLPVQGFRVTISASLEMAAIFSPFLFSSSLLRAQLSHRFERLGLTFEGQVLVREAHQIVRLVYYLQIGLFIFCKSLWRLEIERGRLSRHEAVSRLGGTRSYADLRLELGHLPS